METINGTTYITKMIEVKGNTYSVLFVSGNSNYISIRKETNNPYKTVGKEFKDLNTAIDSYKSVAMKAALMMCK